MNVQLSRTQARALLKAAEAAYQAGRTHHDGPLRAGALALQDALAQLPLRNARRSKLRHARVSLTAAENRLVDAVRLIDAARDRLKERGTE